MKNSKKRGFTIVELVIVIAVIAILAGVLIPTFVSIINKANESNDIQAVRNMNTFLASAKVTDEVNSILDVYDLFDESGFSVENYKPLYKDRYYYYDKQYNQILYVDANNTVLFPAEHQGKTYASLGHDWMSLGMTMVKAVSPSEANYSNDSTTKTITATVANAAEYAYVIENYSKASSDETSLNLEINGTIDMMGSGSLFKEARGTITITGKNNAVIKNITSNDFATTSTSNASGIASQYAAGALVENLTGNLTIKDVTFENLNVKEIYTGYVGLIVGQIKNGGTLELNNVTIKNSTIIGHRDVAAIAGGVLDTGNVTLSGNVVIENVNVMTTGGRVAFMVAHLEQMNGLKVNSGAKFVKNNSKISIYKCDASEQQFVNGTPTEKPTGWSNEAWSTKRTIEGQECYIYSVKNPDDGKGSKEYKAYGYRSDALVLYSGVKPWKAYTTLDAFIK